MVQDLKWDIDTREFYLVGGGIASLTSAVFLIRDGHIAGDHIHILEESNVTGGSMDGSGDAEHGYVIRGGRMFDEEAYTCLFGIMDTIPSLHDQKLTIKDEFYSFNQQIKTSGKARLIDKNLNKIDVSMLGFDRTHRLAMLDIMLLPEEVLGTKRIDECFPPSFFSTTFWFMWATTFAFQPWHSAVEFKRYLHRFLHELPRISDLSGVRRTPFNQYDSIILPITKWLEAHGVHFDFHCTVTALDFAPENEKQTVIAIHGTRDNQPFVTPIRSQDVVFVTIGSMTSGASLGTMNSAPAVLDKEADGAWALWENIAKKSLNFGNPSIFDQRIPESLWESFTITLYDRALLDKIIAFSNNQPGTGALLTCKDSSWLMSIVVPYQPHFINQPRDVQVFWGYALFPDNVGDFVKKKMTDCTGKEILQELCGQLGFLDEFDQMCENAKCIPCIMPFITSQFLTRAKGDRPKVVPDSSTNLAFLGQFSEIPDDVVFTVDYSVRSAQTAVYTLLAINKPITPIYQGQYDVRVLINTLKTLLKDDNLQMELELVKRMIG